MYPSLYVIVKNPKENLDMKTPSLTGAEAHGIKKWEI